VQLLCVEINPDKYGIVGRVSKRCGGKLESLVDFYVHYTFRSILYTLLHETYTARDTNEPSSKTNSTCGQIKALHSSAVLYWRKCPQQCRCVEVRDLFLFKNNKHLDKKMTRQLVRYMRCLSVVDCEAEAMHRLGHRNNLRTVNQLEELLFKVIDAHLKFTCQALCVQNVQYLMPSRQSDSLSR